MMEKNIFSYADMVIRNMGIFSASDQEILKKSCIAIAGCGGAGGEAAVSLARMGVCNFKLADPDVFDVSNLNRQFGSGVSTIGFNKAEIIAKNISDVNPFSNIKVFPSGISDTNVDSFVQGADLVIEEIDFESPYYSALLHRSSRKNNIPVLSGIDVAWGAFLFAFYPDSQTFEQNIGLDSNVKLENIKNYIPPLSAYAPEIPEYLNSELLVDISQGKIDAPVVASSVCFTAGIISSFASFMLTGKREVLPAPYYYYTGDMLLLAPRKNN